MTPGRSETPVVFECSGARLIGIVHRPAGEPRVGVVIVVGGPQYRVGSHRQFVLLARALADAGYAVLRFDYRGMGDSDGDGVDFEACGPDIEAAVATLREQVHGLRRFVLAGLCDAASAVMMKAWSLDDVAGLVLINPWVRTEQTLAQTQLRHHYTGRLLSRRFWRRLFTGQVDVSRAVGDGLRTVAQARRSRTARANGGHDDIATRPFPDRMLAGMEQYDGPVLLVSSGRDMTSREFDDLVAATPRWQRRLAADGVRRLVLPDANHTLARRDWRERFTDATINWLDEL